MLFNSIQFAVFLPIVFFIYWIIGYAKISDSLKLRMQNSFVVIASYVFYGWWDWRFLILIAFTSFCSWGSGLLIHRTSLIRRKIVSSKFWLVANIVLNLGILAVFKYYDFFVTSFAGMLGVDASRHLLNVILPVGISFYTFQALSYSIDVYRGKIQPTKDAVAFFAYVSFFPQLVAGPIERATNLLPQFEKNRSFDYAEAVDGCRRILWGLFKKIIVADNCAIYVDQIWGNYANQSGSTLVLAAILFAFQVYGDFSGYSDIAIGTSKLFGITLMDNFLTPYFSRNVAEFWKRWHISLNTWFVDYVYIPLGGSREGRWNTIRNTFVIFLLSGLWHGANWTYVGWGAYHALLFVPLILLGTTKKYRDTARFSQFPQIILTFILVAFGLIIFRAPSIVDAWEYVSKMFSSGLLTMPYLVNRHYYMPLFVNLMILVCMEWCNRNRKHPLDLSFIHNHMIKYAIYIILILLIIFFTPPTPSPFIYFQF